MTDLAETYKTGIEDTAPIEGNQQLMEPTPEKDTVDLFLNMQPLTDLSNKSVVRVPRSPNFSRKEVVQAFQTAFELIGGVPRLALWGNENPNEFYKLYGKLLPSSNSSALGEQSKLVIEMAIKPGGLDRE